MFPFGQTKRSVFMATRPSSKTPPTLDFLKTFGEKNQNGGNTAFFESEIEEKT